MRSIAKFSLALFLFLPLLAAAQGYTTVSPPQPTEDPQAVEVYEFFSYGCPHCFEFHPLMKAWAKSAPERVKIIRVPITFDRPSWTALAKGYHAADLLGVADKLHEPFFNAVHVQNRRFRDDDDAIEFMVEQGLPREDVEKAFNSMAMKLRLRQANSLAVAHRILSTPSIAIEGKYVISPSTAKGQKPMIQVMDQLVRQELAKLPAAPAKE